VSTTAQITVIRQARLVPVGRSRSVRHSEPVDLRIFEGRVTAIAPRLDVAGADLVLDAAGRWAIPGLWDAHVHLRQWAQTRSRLDVGAARTAAEVIGLVAELVAGLPDSDSVVFGYGYRSAMWPLAPTVAELDAVSGDHPVILASGDGHNGWLNSAAFRLLDVPGRTGALVENEWFALTPAITALAGTVVEDRPAIAAAVADAASRGIIGITDFELALGFRDWPERFARGMDLLRVRPAVYPDGLDAAISAGLRTGDPLEGTDALVTMGPLKIISDGSLNTRTAYCYEPYADTPGADRPNGMQNYDIAQLTELLQRATTHGLEIALHAIGDAAVGVALDAFTATGASGGIEHAQLMCRSDIGRMASLGLRASVQPAHLLDDRDVTARCWPDRADRCFMFRSLLTAGVELALGSDAPVAALDPWLAMAAAVHRSGDERNPWNPAEALTAGEALAASTDGQPTLQVGSRGDVVLLNHDPLRAAAGAGDSAEVAAHLRRVGVAASLVAGRPTHLAL
jgi:predicted amidohydrolase YtcJ